MSKIKKKERRPIWNDSGYGLEVRIADLLGRMTLAEKISQLTVDAPAIDRLGVHKFTWGGECLHGLCNTGRATQYPMPIALASTFDSGLIERIAETISDEARAKYHDMDWGRSPRISLVYYTPVINILRDPRWGRAQETYGEDPVLTSRMGAAFVRGLQGNHPEYLKVAACAKHLGVHSGPERLRNSFNAQVSRKDMAETYLSAFKALVDAGVETVMATYNRVNGEHCCASTVMIGEFLRGKFGFTGMVMSDGGALGSLHETHKMTKDAVETAGLCLKNGCDQEIGQNAYPFAQHAIDRGMISEEDIDRAVARILRVRFRLGDFDPPKLNPYTRIKRDVIQCGKHLKLARESACKSMVLLKNNGILPLGRKERMIFVTGPTATDLQSMLGNFYRGVSGRLVSILEGITESAPEGVTVTHLQGCFLTHPNLFPSNWAAGMCKWADAVVVAMGYSPLMEGENGECIGAPAGGDKAGISLPANQLEFLREVKKEGKPVIAVVTGGSPMELGEVHRLADAVLLAWYPGEQGGAAVGDLLFGKESPSGKLPVTFPKSLRQVPPFEDYDMTKRSYRYIRSEPQYPFGFGLSYAKFAYSELKLSKSELKLGKGLSVTVKVKNIGLVNSDELVQVYLTDMVSSEKIPRWALKDFRRISLKPGKSRKLKFRIRPEMMELYREDGEAIIEPGSFRVIIGGSSPGTRSRQLGAPEPVSAKFKVV